MLQKRYTVAKDLPFIPVGGEITYDPQDNKYHYGYFTMPAELIGKSDWFEEIPVDETIDPLEEIQQLIDEAKRIRLDASNKLGHYKQQVAQGKRIQNVRQIEGIHQAVCAVLVIDNVQMCTSGTEIFFSRTDAKKNSSKFLRDDLENLNIVQLTDTISLAIRSLVNKV